MGYRAKNPELRKVWIKLVQITLKSVVDIQYQTRPRPVDCLGKCAYSNFWKVFVWVILDD